MEQSKLNVIKVSHEAKLAYFLFLEKMLKGILVAQDPKLKIHKSSRDRKCPRCIDGFAFNGREYIFHIQNTFPIQSTS